MATQNQFIVIKSQTAATTSIIWDARACDSITVAADNLAGGEIVQLLVIAGTTAKQVTDIYGTAINLTVNCSSVALEGGAQYQFRKDVTAGACAVYVSVKLGS
jgi:hypothetical protein